MRRTTSRASDSQRGIARRYRVSPAWISKRIQSGELPAVRTGRRRLTIFYSDFERLLREYEIEPNHDVEKIVERLCHSPPPSR